MDLAIIIPAYKASYLSNALQSLALQTCKLFNVYIGDDCSPEPIESIVSNYRDRLNLKYHRFESNLGGKDLVAHWRRCVQMSKEEKWIWLFSDDDEMEPACVEKFYETIRAGKNYDLYHFNVIAIDKLGNTSHLSKLSKRPFPQFVSSKDFVIKRLKYQINSFVVEYIFRRKTFEENGGFQQYDMAWGTDDATWAKISIQKGIYTIEGPKVRWRYSGENITSIESTDIMIRKGCSVVKLLTFYSTLYRDKSLNKWYYYYYLHMLYNVMKSCDWIDVERIIKMYKKEHTDFVPYSVWILIHKIIKINDIFSR